MHLLKYINTSQILLGVRNHRAGADFQIIWCIKSRIWCKKSRSFGVKKVAHGVLILFTYTPNSDNIDITRDLDIKCIKILQIHQERQLIHQIKIKRGAKNGERNS